MPLIPAAQRWHGREHLTYSRAITCPRSPDAKGERRGMWWIPDEDWPAVQAVCATVGQVCGLELIEIQSQERADILFCGTSTMRAGRSGYTDAQAGNGKQVVVWLGSFAPDLVIHELSHALGFVHSRDTDTVSNPTLCGGAAWTEADREALVRAYGPVRRRG